VTDGAITADRFDRVTYMNSAAEAMTGFSRRLALGKPLAKVIPIVDTETGAAIKKAVNAAKQCNDAAAPRRRALMVRGARKPSLVEYAVTAIRDPEGGVLGSVSIVRDISQGVPQPGNVGRLPHAESDATVNDHERAEVTLDSISDGVISTDFRGRVSFLNQNAEKITGWTNDEAKGRALDEILHLKGTHTREPVTFPGLRAIIEDRTIVLDTPTVLMRRDGSEVDVEPSASPIHAKGGGVIGAVLVIHDVTAAREQAEKLARLALYDGLTRLPNRTLLLDRLEQALERARRNASPATVLFVDLDRFKPVNDSLGHAIGDQLLIAVAQRLLASVRRSDTVSRFGGDEFVILLENIAHPGEATRCAAKIMEAISTPFEIAGHTLHVGASIGMASFPEDARDATQLLRRADLRMYEDKSKRHLEYDAETSTA
jgi:diguanylate cyclase (GGDEF)-like protein/PAS domain S-box-containing protein